MKERQFKIGKWYVFIGNSDLRNPFIAWWPVAEDGWMVKIGGMLMIVRRIGDPWLRKS